MATSSIFDVNYESTATGNMRLGSYLKRLFLFIIGDWRLRHIDINTPRAQFL